MRVDFWCFHSCSAVIFFFAPMMLVCGLKTVEYSPIYVKCEGKSVVFWK